MAKSGGFAGVIDSVEYYFEMDKDAALAKGLASDRVDVEGNVIPAGTKSYYDNGAPDSMGKWINFARTAAPVDTPMHHAVLAPGPHSELFENCVHGAKVNGLQLRAFSKGVDPATMTRQEGSGLLDPNSGTRIYSNRPRKGVVKDPGGYDLTMAPPKEVSFFMLTEEGEARDHFVAEHQAAYTAALQWAWEQGYFCTRKANEEGIQEFVPVKEMGCATFTHFTSRENDPQVHNHAAIMRMAIDHDGNICALDNRLLRQYQGVINAMYRTELVSRLKKSMPDYHFAREGRNFKIEGFPDQIRDLFSKRRKQVIEAVKELEKKLGVPLDVAIHRDAAQNAARQSRKAKEHTPLDALLDSWKFQLNASGYSIADMKKFATEAAKLARMEEGLGLDESDEGRKGRLIELAMKEVGKVLDDNTTLTNARLLQAVSEALQCEAEGTDEVMSVLAEIEAHHLKHVKDNLLGPIWTTEEIWQREIGMLKTAFERKNEFEYVSAKLVEQAIASKTPSPEQAAAVREVLNRDGISLLQGFAGTGKSYTTDLVRIALESAGRKVWGTAPSWVATEILSKDSHIAAENVMVLAKLLHEYRAGKIEFNQGDAIIVDEAGMVDLQAMSEIVEISRKHGLKLILQGDVAQYRPVGAGAPFDALQKVLKPARLQNIQRQKGRNLTEAKWMLAASIDLATHDPSKQGPNQVRRAIEAYEKAGHVHWSSDEDAAIEQTVALYMRHRLDRPDESRAIITERNANARALSEAIRERMLAEGLLSEDAVVIDAIPRGDGAKPFKLELREGDPVIFGENVLVNGVQLRNADKGVVTSIVEGPNSTEPTITVRLEKGVEVTGRISEFIGKRYEDEEANVTEPALPKIQHCYAMTGHSMQGVTIDYAIDLHLHSRGSNGTYVGTTRHRKEADIVIATGRIRDDLELQGAASMSLQSGGQLVSAGEEDDVLSAPTDEAIKDKFYAEVGGADPTGNVSDLMNRTELFEAIGHPIETPAETITRAQALEERMEARLTAPEGYKAQTPNMPRRIGVRPDGTLAQRSPEQSPPVSPSPSTTPSKPQALAQRMAQGRFTPEELNGFRQINIDEFLRNQGFDVVGGDGAEWLTGKKGEVYRALRDPSLADGSIVNVAKWPNGAWTIAARDNALVDFKKSIGRPEREWNPTGDIILLAQWKTGKPWKEVCQALRQYQAMTPEERKANPIFPQRDRVREKEEGFTRSGTAGSSTAPVAKPKLDPEKAARIIRFNWQQMLSGANDYLVRVRGIMPEVLKRFAADIKTEPNVDKPWFRPGAVAFAHRNLAGDIVGYERKGEGWQDGGKRSFSQMAYGSDKRLTMMGDRENPTTIIVGEVGIEVLSKFQHDGLQAGRFDDRTLLCSPFGMPKDEALEQFAEMVAKWPEARIVLAMNNDGAGQLFTDKFRAAVVKGRGTDAGVTVEQPPKEFNDWNDCIRGRTIEVAERIKAEARAELEAKAAEERARQEAERKAAEEAARKAQEPSLVPRM